MPTALRDAGYSVVTHNEHFPEGTLDPQWYPEVARQGWVALSKDTSQRYEHVDEIMRAGVAVFMYASKARDHRMIAEAFRLAMPRIIQLRSKHQPPFIAKVYAPEAKTRYLTKPGRVVAVLTKAAWEAHKRRTS